VTLRILSSIPVCGDRESGTSAGGANEIEHLLIAIQWLRPVLGDFREQTVLDGIPFASAGGIVSYVGSEVELVAQYCTMGPEFGFSKRTKYNYYCRRSLTEPEAWERGHSGAIARVGIEVGDRAQGIVSAPM
jgi:hypothetical protein